MTGRGLPLIFAAHPESRRSFLDAPAHTEPAFRPENALPDTTLAVGGPLPPAPAKANTYQPSAWGVALGLKAAVVPFFDGERETDTLKARAGAQLVWGSDLEKPPQPDDGLRIFVTTAWGGRPGRDTTPARTTLADVHEPASRGWDAGLGLEFGGLFFSFEHTFVDEGHSHSGSSTTRGHLGFSFRF